MKLKEYLPTLPTICLITIGALSYMPIPTKWFGFKDIDYNCKIYSVKKTNERTIIVSHKKDSLFNELLEDKDNDNILDKHYFRSVMPSPRVGSFGFSKTVTQEDKDLYSKIIGIYNNK